MHGFRRLMGFAIVIAGTALNVEGLADWIRHTGI